MGRREGRGGGGRRGGRGGGTQSLNAGNIWFGSLGHDHYFCWICMQLCA